jgi:hypothetical protein
LADPDCAVAAATPAQHEKDSDPQSAMCAECAQLRRNSAAVLLQYVGALDALALPPSADPACTDPWTDLFSVSERLYRAQKLECIHHYGHHDVVKGPDRRVYAVADRRRTRRGGRRWNDHSWSAPPLLVACASCAGGTADFRALTTESASTGVLLTYRCRDCGLRFDRLADR